MQGPVREVREGDLDLPIDTPESGVTELLVHGVGGAAPEAMLDEPVVRQVTGDRISGMWRGKDRYLGGEARWHREAYSWGGLTSSALTSALWLLLAPLAVVNMAGWMAVGRRFTDTGRPDWRIAYQQALVRVIAIAATWTYVLFVAQVAMDLGAWQCTQIGRCRVGDWPQLISVPVAGYPGRVVVLASVVPLLFVGGLYLLTRVSVRRYEAFPVSNRPAGPVDLPRSRLTDPQFWSGAAYANLSRWLHLASSVLLLAYLLGAVARHGGRYPELVRALTNTTLVLLGVAVVCAGWQKPRILLFTGARRVGAAFAVTNALFVLAAWLAWVQPAAQTSDPRIMPGIPAAFTVLVLLVYVTSLLHGAMAFAGRRALGDDPVRPPRVPAPFTTLAVGCWLLFAVWAGTAMWVARWLSPSAKTASGVTDGHLLYPVAYPVLAQLSIAGGTLVLAVSLVFVYVTWRRRRPSVLAECRFWRTQRLAGDWERATAQRAAGDTGDGPETPAEVAAEAPTRWLRGVRTAKWWTANAVSWLEATLGWAASLAATGGVGFSLWIGNGWLHGAGLMRAVAAVVLACAGLTVVVWATVRTDLPGNAVPRRSAGQLVQVAAGWLVLVGCAVAAVRLLGPLPALLAHRRPAGQLTSVWVPREAFASTVLSLVPVASVLLVRQAINSRSTRRLVGIAWDIATFWPRSFHPLAPPSYAERAVPELHLRVRHLLTGGNAVLLLGHSQGAVLVTAVLARLTDVPAHVRRRLSVVTYGNPVRRLYMRWFPSYIHPAVLADTLPAEGPRLVNFYRRTDPIGSRLYHVGEGATVGRAGGDPTEVPAWHGDCWLPDPPTDLHRPGDGTPRVRGHAHGGYVRQSTFADHVCAEVRRLDDLSG